MSWYTTEGQLYDFVLFSRVRYIRNIAKQSFYPDADLKRSSESVARLDSILQKNGFRCEKIAPGVTAQVLSLAEKGFVGRDFVYTDKPRALYQNEPCNLLILLGGDNFLSITSCVSGAGIGEAKNMAAGAEELIDLEMPFAYLEGIGYLSPKISDCGSGIELSSALYLPSLRLTDARSALVSALSRIGMSLCPMMGDRENSGDIYILSYIPHHLADEDSAVAHFADTVQSIVEKEKARLGMIFKNRDKTIFESARRALGALIYSCELSESEMLSLLSDIRLAICTRDSVGDALPRVGTLNYLSCEGLSASVMLSSKEKCSSIEECDRARAALVRGYIEHKKEVKNVK